MYLCYFLFDFFFKFNENEFFLYFDLKSISIK